MEPTAAEKIEVICRVLKRRGESGTAYRLSQLLGVSPSTVTRWMHGQAVPRGRSADALDYLYRASVKWEEENGHPDAEKILGAVLGGAGAVLLGLGPAGMLIAAGLGWLVGEQAQEEARIKKNDPKRGGSRP